MISPLRHLLRVANSSPPPITRREFYNLKDRLLRSRAVFRGHDLQEIIQPCWGPYDRIHGHHIGCQGGCCPRCGGSGVYDKRWVRLERWDWGGSLFHIPSGETRIPPDPGTSVTIHGLVHHRDYGRASGEAVLWLYALCGEWRTFWRELSSHCAVGWTWWPLLNAQKVAMRTAMLLERRTCYCGRRFWTLGSGWCCCRRCRNRPEDPMPF